MTDHGAGNDSEPLGLAFNHQVNAICIATLLPAGSFISLYTHDTVVNTRIMICFSQRGLRSLSASSSTSIFEYAETCEGFDIKYHFSCEY